MRKSILIINYETEGINPRLCANSRASVMAACERWGCDFIEINHSNTKLTLAPAAEKTKLFNEIEGEHVLVLDSDVVINSTAPSPFEVFPEDCMTVIQNATPRHGQYGIVKQIEREEWSKVEGEYGPVEYVPEHYFNTGVMLVRKDLHTEVFKMAKEIHQGLSVKNIGLNWCDQTPINYATKKLGIKMNYAGDEWNYVLPSDLGPDWLQMKAHIYHLAGMPARNELLPRILWK
jgi:hypothetical protein